MREEKGFTLIEVIVSIAIVSILAAIAIPSYRFIINSGRVSSDMNALVGTLQFARSEAIRRGLSVTVCASATSTVTTNGTPSPTCATASNWQVGWVSFVDVNNSASFDTGDTVVSVQGPLESGNTLVASGSTVALRFNREGFVSGLTSGPVLITLTPPNNGATQKRCLSVSSVGRLRQLKPATGIC